MKKLIYGFIFGSCFPAFANNTKLTFSYIKYFQCPEAHHIFMNQYKGSSTPWFFYQGYYTKEKETMSFTGGSLDQNSITEHIMPEYFIGSQIRGGNVICIYISSNNKFIYIQNGGDVLYKGEAYFDKHKDKKMDSLQNCPENGDFELHPFKYSTKKCNFSFSFDGNIK